MVFSGSSRYPEVMLSVLKMFKTAVAGEIPSSRLRSIAGEILVE
jgi:hypothetical protein